LGNSEGHSTINLGYFWVRYSAMKFNQVDHLIVATVNRYSEMNRILLHLSHCIKFTVLVNSTTSPHFTVAPGNFPPQTEAESRIAVCRAERQRDDGSFIFSGRVMLIKLQQTYFSPVRVRFFLQIPFRILISPSFCRSM
jgi:hypothetical protein